MNFGAFAGGMGQGIQDARDQSLKQKMLQGMMKPALLTPGYEDPSQQMSVAGPADFNPQGLRQPNFIQQLMKMLGGLGG